ncbi:MAG: hypothetical protein OXC63_05945 [Aestuariivita sp.]|nr:hypothetical protein [Aestuariivita sp.]
MAAKTRYFVEVRAVPGGSGIQRIARKCFMTGGTYTMAVDSGVPTVGNVSWCFSITLRTPQDIRNCFCGRGNNSPHVLGLFSNETQNQAVRNHNGGR